MRVGEGRTLSHAVRHLRRQRPRLHRVPASRRSSATATTTRCRTAISSTASTSSSARRACRSRSASGAPGDVGEAIRRPGVDTVVRAQAVVGALIVGVSYIDTTPYHAGAVRRGPGALRRRRRALDARRRAGARRVDRRPAVRRHDAPPAATSTSSCTGRSMGPVTALARAERLVYDGDPAATRSTRIATRPARASGSGRDWPPSIGVGHQAGQLTQCRRDGARPRPDATPLRHGLLSPRWPPSHAAIRALPWHRRLEARVALALALLVAGALGAVLVVTIAAGVDASRATRAGDELDVARTAFYSLLESRAASAIALTTLVTELPVFRAHLTDARLAERPRHHRRDGRRLPSAAGARTSSIVTDADGRWLASPGWPTRRRTGAGARWSARSSSRAQAGTTGARASSAAAASCSWWCRCRRASPTRCWAR